MKFAASLTILLSVFAASAANWPGWRGPEGTGISPDKNLPTRWSTNENVRWRAELPGRGNSSPIVWGNRVFVAQAVSSDNRRTVMCFDRDSGKLLWQSGVTYTEREQTQRDNPYCSATPVTDGERVIAFFGSAGLFCYDFAGKELWRRELGKMNHMFGNGASPTLVGDLCIVNFGPDEKARLIALNKKTGETVWEVQPPKIDPSEQQQNRALAGGPGGDAARDGAANERRERPNNQNRPEAGRNRGFGIGDRFAAQLLSAADKNADKKLSKEEFNGLGQTWYDKLDSAKAGKVSQEQFAEKFYESLPQGPSPAQSDDENQPNRGPSRSTAPALFAALDSDKNSTLTKSDFNATFAKWYGEWEKENSVSEEGLRAGLNGIMPRGNFAGGGGGPGGGRGGGGGASWSTPLVIKTAGREELIMNFPYRVVSYDAKSGKELWSAKGVGGTIYTTPVWGEGVLFATTSGPGGGAAVAVKPGGSGDVSESQKLWKLDRAKGSIGSGVIHEGHLYTISQDGIAACLDVKTGKTVWEERLRGSGSRNGSWSSIVLADGKLFVPNQAGDVFVVKASPKFEVVATNSVYEATNASLAAADGRIYMRTDKALWCFAAKKD